MPCRSAERFDRKNLTWLFAKRVKALMGVIHNGQLHRLADAISRKDEKAAAALLAG